MDFSEAQKVVKQFAIDLHWEDFPDLHQIDHAHEELVEISQHIRYLDRAAAQRVVEEKHDIFQKEFGDAIFCLVRMANQFHVDLEEAFKLAEARIRKKYEHDGRRNIIADQGLS
jgi:NTP pyrophosphatase (non-canonical NTP hydrolase)